MNIANQTLGAGLATPTNANTALPTNQVAQAPTVVQPVVPHTSQPNWFERLLPTIGSVAGGLITAPLEALDAVSGIGGTALNIAGASGGGALGKFIENKLTGQGGGNGVLGSAIAGGAGQGIGEAVSPVLTGVLGKASGLLNTGASKLFAAQGPGVGEDLANFATQHLGINDLPTAAKFGQIISGSTDPIANPDKGLVSKLVQDAAEQDKSTVDLSNLQPALKGGSKSAVQSQGLTSAKNIGEPGSNITEQLISNSGLGGTNEANGLRSQIAGVLGRVGNPGSVSKADLLGMQKQIAGFASDASQAAARSGASVDAAKANVLNGVNQQLKSALGFDTLKVAPQQAKALADDILANGSSVSQSGAQAVAKDITDAANSPEGLTVGQLRNMESNMVQLQTTAKNAISAKDKNFGMSTTNILPVAGGIAGGGKSNLLGTIAGLATASPKADAVASGTLSGLSKITGKAAASKIIPLLTKSGAIAGANLVAGNDTPAPQPALNGTITQGASMNNQPPTQGTTVSTNPLLAIYNQLMAENQADPNNASTSSILSTLNSIAPQVQKQQLAAPVINNTLQDFQNAGGAQGTGGGLMARLEALIPGTAANTYQKQQATAAATLSQLLGISPQSAMSAMPQLMSTQQTANPQLQTLQSIFGNIGG